MKTIVFLALIASLGTGYSHPSIASSDKSLKNHFAMQHNQKIIPADKKTGAHLATTRKNTHLKAPYKTDGNRLASKKKSGFHKHTPSKSHSSTLNAKKLKNNLSFDRKHNKAYLRTKGFAKDLYLHNKGQARPHNKKTPTEKLKLQNQKIKKLTHNNSSLHQNKSNRKPYHKSAPHSNDRKSNVKNAHNHNDKKMLNNSTSHYNSRKSGISGTKKLRTRGVDNKYQPHSKTSELKKTESKSQKKSFSFSDLFDNMAKTAGKITSSARSYFTKNEA
ncbi:hypothetical protein BB560_002542 [Smittium megazygosporum]|uniref:Uncharacterized protein n=1 Tax=Smittium megazygosporum TaxID=133381 RepID=A0A2T9ZEF5_9FUNG|nr:hypothetical protein BB560_002542 [Smittium megazygosporum]